MGNIIDLQAERSGADLTQAGARAFLVEEVIAKLNPPKKKTARVVDESGGSGHLRSEKQKSPEKLYRCDISKTGKLLFTADDTLFLFEAFCRHHGFNPHKKEDIDAVRDLVTEGGEKCEWAAVAKRVARENPKDYGEHPTGDITRQALKHRVKVYLRESSSSSYIGRRRALPETAIAMIVATISAILAAHTLVFTISLLRPIALGVIAAAGCAHLPTDGGAGRFFCSRFWLSDVLKRSKERITFRKPQGNSG